MLKDNDLLRLMWGTIAGNEITVKDGTALTIISCGGEDMEAKVFRGATLVIDGVRMRGDIVFGESEFITPRSAEYAILHVVSGVGGSYVMNLHGEPISQLVLEMPPEFRCAAESIGADGSRGCGQWLGSSLQPVDRISIMQGLSMERMERKRIEVELLCKSLEGDWAQTLYVMLFRAMGGNKNKAAYIRLASLATYKIALRERGSIDCVESLLLGTAGMLEGLYFDDYIRQLSEHFIYLSRKYGIMPMKPDEWEYSGMRSANHPVARIVQLASFVSRLDFMFDRIMGCRTREDIHALFNAEVSGYWATHYLPDASGERCPKRIGSQKAELLAINAVIPVMFAYGEYAGRFDLKEAAMDLYSDIPAEHNTIITRWSGDSVPIKNAMDSQAVVQLNNEYCAKGRCGDCVIGRRIMKGRLREGL